MISLDNCKYISMRITCKGNHEKTNFFLNFSNQKLSDFQKTVKIVENQCLGLYSWSENIHICPFVPEFCILKGIRVYVDDPEQLNEFISLVKIKNDQAIEIIKLIPSIYKTEYQNDDKYSTIKLPNIIYDGDALILQINILNNRSAKIVLFYV